MKSHKCDALTTPDKGPWLLDRKNGSLQSQLVGAGEMMQWTPAPYGRAIIGEGDNDRAVVSHWFDGRRWVYRYRGLILRRKI